MDGHPTGLDPPLGHPAPEGLRANAYVFCSLLNVHQPIFPSLLLETGSGPPALKDRLALRYPRIAYANAPPSAPLKQPKDVLCPLVGVEQIDRAEFQ